MNSIFTYDVLNNSNKKISGNFSGDMNDFKKFP